MRILFLIFSAVVLFSCSYQTEEKTEIIEKTDTQTKPVRPKLTPDFSVALRFINDYTDFCKKSTPKNIDTTWIERNPLLTDNFKTAYNNLLDSAEKADPDYGLGFDPIFHAQDFPDNGFSIYSADTSSGYVTVMGNDWNDFKLVLKVVQKDKKWLVDGSGVINIPLKRQIKD